MSTSKPMSSVLIPMQQRPLLLPAACIADIQNYSRPDDNYPDIDWLLGDIHWRGQTIPLISFERMNQGRFAEFSATNRVAIMNRTTKDKHGLIPFYAIVTQGVPQPLTLMHEEIRNSAEEPGVIEKHRVILREIPASIPDLKNLELQLQGALSEVHEGI